MSAKSPKKTAGAPLSFKTSFVEDKKVSPDPSAVPDTPDSLRTKNSISPNTSYENRSPVSRGQHSKAVRGKTSLMVTRKLIQPQKNISPEPVDSFKPKNGTNHSGSVKRLLYSSENIQSAKRPRTMSVQKPLKGSDSDSSLLGTNISVPEDSLLKAFSKNPVKKIKADVAHFGNSRVVPGSCAKVNRNTNGVCKSSKKSSYHLNPSKCDKENSITGLSVVSETNDLDLVMSHSSRTQKGSSEEETLVSCPVTMKRPLKVTAELQAKDKSADGKTLSVSLEDEFNDLMDDWFDDVTEQTSEAPKPKKFNIEYEYFACLCKHIRNCISC